MLTAWKEREPVYRRRRASIAAEHGGVVPAYATGTASEQVELDKGARRLRRGQRLTTPDDPDGNVSREEFEELVRDLHVDPCRRAARRSPTARRRRPSPLRPLPRRPSPRPSARDESADALPEDVVMPPRDDDGAAARRKRASAAAKRRGKHGRPRKCRPAHAVHDQENR